MSTLLDRGRRGEFLADCEIIDMHGHLGLAGFAIPDVSAASLVKGMDRVGIHCCLCAAMPSPSAAAAAGNDLVLSAMRQYPGRILGYAVAFPLDAPTVRQEVRRRLDEGFTGIKLHNLNGFPYNDPAYEPAYAIANERRLPVLLHTWAQDREFEDIRAVSDRYPEAVFLLAHAGTDKEQEYYRIAEQRPNVMLDPTISRIPRGLIERMVQAVGAEKIVWGSDAVFLDQAHQLGKLLAAKITDEQKKTIFSGNAKRILGGIRR